MQNPKLNGDSNDRKRLRIGLKYIRKQKKLSQLKVAVDLAISREALSYYENGGTYQISGLEYDIMDRDWVGGCRVISKDNPVSFVKTDVPTIMNGKITLDGFKKYIL